MFSVRGSGFRSLPRELAGGADTRKVYRVPLATSRDREKNPDPQTENMAYAMAEEHQLREFGVTYNGAMEDAIATR